MAGSIELGEIIRTILTPSSGLENCKAGRKSKRGALTFGVKTFVEDVSAGFASWYLVGGWSN